jgi:nucleotide-binding universal stress UspA family protein
MYDRIVVPLDGSELSERALGEAEQFARMADAPIHLVRVIDMLHLERFGQFVWALDAAMMQPAIEDEEALASSYLAETAGRLTATGLDVSTEVRRGRADREIVDASKRGDLIVMASHGRSGFAHALLGSIAEQVVRYSQVPVLIVRQQA